MGVATAALSDVETFLRHNPIIGVAGYVGGALTGLVTLTSLCSVAAVLVLPLFAGGLIGTAWAGRDGDATALDFFESVHGRYDSLLAGYLLFGLALVGTLAVPAAWTLLLTHVVQVSVDAGLTGTLEGLLAGVPGGDAAAALDALFLPVVVVWFLLVTLLVALGGLFDVAVVVEDRPVADGFERAWELFLAAPSSLLGYTVVRTATIVAGVLLPLAALGAADLTVGFQSGGPTAVVGSAVYLFVLVPFAFVGLVTYHVAYYNRLTFALARSRADGETDETGDDARSHGSRHDETPAGRSEHRTGVTGAPGRRTRTTSTGDGRTRTTGSGDRNSRSGDGRTRTTRPGNGQSGSTDVNPRSGDSYDRTAGSADRHARTTRADGRRDGEDEDTNVGGRRDRRRR